MIKDKPSKGTDMDEHKLRILMLFVEDRPVIYYEDIVGETGLSDINAREALYSLVDTGALVKNGPIYSLP